MLESSWEQMGTREDDHGDTGHPSAPARLLLAATYGADPAARSAGPEDPESPTNRASGPLGHEAGTVAHLHVLVVLRGWLANSSPPLIRALEAYRKLDLTAVTERRRREIPKRARRLTAAEQALLVERYQAGATVYDLAREFRIARGTAAAQLKAAGVELRCGPLSQQEIALATELYETGLSTTAIGPMLGRHHSAIWRVLKAAGVPLRDTHGRERRL